MIEFSERVTIPDRCKRCIVLGRIAFLHDEMSRDVDTITEYTLSDTLNQSRIESLVRHAGIPYDEAADYIESNQSEIIKSTADLLDKMDEVCDEHVDMANWLIETCPDGELSMRARRNGHEVVVRVCMSDIRESATIGWDLGAELVGIERRVLHD